MKAILIFLIGLLLSGNLYANKFFGKEHAQKKQEIRYYQKQSFICIRDLLEVNGKQVRPLAAELLGDLQTAGRDPEALENVLNDCNYYFNSLDLRANFAYDSKYDPIMDDLLDNSFSCRSNGLEFLLQAGIPVTIGANFTIGSCQAPSGRKFSINSIGGSAGIGVGAYIGGRTDEFAMTMLEVEEGVSKMQHYYGGKAAFIIGGSFEKNSSQGQSKGIGFGGVLSANITTTLPIEIGDLDNDFSDLKDKLDL
tara:strand:+ start:71358 stop:72113 length:756 start_codon:yes stop_codon:yes gene_type:complete